MFLRRVKNEAQRNKKRKKKETKKQKSAHINKDSHSESWKGEAPPCTIRGNEFSMSYNLGFL